MLHLQQWHAGYCYSKYMYILLKCKLKRKTALSWFLFSGPSYFPVQEKAREVHGTASRNKGVLSTLAFTLWLSQAKGNSFHFSPMDHVKKSLYEAKKGAHSVWTDQQLAGCSTGLARLLVNYKWFMMSFWAWSDNYGACIQEWPGHIPPVPLGRYLARISCYSGSIWESKLCSQPITCVFYLARKESPNSQSQYCLMTEQNRRVNRSLK